MKTKIKMSSIIPPTSPTKKSPNKETTLKNSVSKHYKKVDYRWQNNYEDKNPISWKELCKQVKQYSTWKNEKKGFWITFLWYRSNTNFLH